MDDLEKTLNELALAMQDHREALATKGGRKNPPGPRRKSQPDDARTALIARLLARIEAHAGLRVGEAIEARLGSVLASVELAELGRWVAGLERFDRTHPDWLTLIESLTTNETFLFRDWPQLELLRTSGLAPLIAAAARSTHPALRLWSAGCASGEEAYSLAVLALEALAGAGVATETAQEIELKAPWSLDVLGTDISPAHAHPGAQRSLQHRIAVAVPCRCAAAAAAVFFRPPKANRRGRTGWCGATSATCALRPVQSDGAAAGGRWLRCHRLPQRAGLFAPAARKIVQATLEAAVRRGGFLLLGPTDAPPNAARFETIWGQRAVIYRKRA